MRMCSWLLLHGAERLGNSGHRTMYIIGLSGCGGLDRDMIWAFSNVACSWNHSQSMYIEFTLFATYCGKHMLFV